jgi:hydrogenase expression/formation protein HypE
MSRPAEPERLPTGKLPAALLRQLLDEIEVRDPRVLVGARVGEDAAVLDYGDRLLVAKTDPITFATDLIGWYAVTINANDIAVRGARPLWFLATVLLAQHSSSEQAREIFRQIEVACRDLGVSLVGGHTEITYGLDRSIVVGCMLGEVQRDRLVTTGGARSGDVLVLTKGIAIEGTAVLAREAAGRLQELGLAPDVIARAANYLFEPGISVVREAQVAVSAAPVHAMHDPTEGGLATALAELAEASGCGVRVYAEAITVLPECDTICRALGLNPLGLLASGALLLAVDRRHVQAVLTALEDAGIPAAAIGEVTPAQAELLIVHEADAYPLPVFERDELARWLDEQG